MKLKPMDENTLAFLKDLVNAFEEKQNLNAEYALLVHFHAEYDANENSLDDFMEAIKNADTHN